MAADTLKQVLKRINKTDKDTKYLIKKGFKVTPVIEKMRSYLSSAAIDRLYMEFKTYHKDDRAALTINFTNYTPVSPVCGFDFDQFDNRTTSGGWGTSESGYNWDTLSGSDAQSIVSAGRGQLHVGSTYDNFAQVTSPVITDVTSSDRDIVAGVRFTGVTGYSGQPNNYQTIMYMEDIPTGVYVEIVARINGPDAGPIINMSDLDAVITTTPISLVAGTDYILRFRNNNATGFFGVKLYEASLSEPSTWLVEANTSTYAAPSPQLRINTFWNGASDRTTSFDYINFEYECP